MDEIEREIGRKTYKTLPMSAPKDQTQKKGEVNELLTLLRGVNSSKESPAVLNKKKRETLKKVCPFLYLYLPLPHSPPPSSD